MILERDVESRLGCLVDAAGGACVKFIPEQKAGMPDRIVMLTGGILVWVETKRPKGGRLSMLQRIQHKKLRRLGQRVEVVWTGEQAEALLRELTGPRE